MADGPLAVILAAGHGTRMRSARPKALHTVAGRPLVRYSVDLASRVTGRPPVVVCNPAHPGMAEALGERATLVPQEPPRGTGDALHAIPWGLREPGPVVVLSADVPLLRDGTLAALIARHQEADADCTLLTVTPADPRGLGRVIRDREGRVSRIVEAADLPEGARAPSECNAGVYVFRGLALWPALEGLTASNAQGEYYLTDAVDLLEGRIEAVHLDDADEAVGINDRRDLARAEAVLRSRLLDGLMLGGVTVEDPVTTYVDADVEVGMDTVLRPMTVLRGATVLGRDCVIGPMAQLRDVRAGSRVVIGASHLEECVLGDDVVIGQFNRLRPDSDLRDRVSVGTHAEIKNSVVGAGSFISHFSCVLDSDVGAGVNIGAGTVTCNFDGRAKHRTAIGDGAFIGSDSILVAPLTIGAGATTGAGSVITADVPAGALGIARARQRNLEGWAARREAGS